MYLDKRQFFTRYCPGTSGVIPLCRAIMQGISFGVGLSGDRACRLAIIDRQTSPSKAVAPASTSTGAPASGETMPPGQQNITVASPFSVGNSALGRWASALGCARIRSALEFPILSLRSPKKVRHTKGSPLSSEPLVLLDPLLQTKTLISLRTGGYLHSRGAALLPCTGSAQFQDSGLTEAYTPSRCLPQITVLSLAEKQAPAQAACGIPDCAVLASGVYERGIISCLPVTC
jgi:hypothetical protein